MDLSVISFLVRRREEDGNASVRVVGQIELYRKFHSIYSAQFGGQFFSLGLFQLSSGDASHRLWTQHAASPGTGDCLMPVTGLGPDGFHRLSQSSFVSQATLREGNSGAGLPVDPMSQPGLPLDDATGNPHLTTQGSQEATSCTGSTSCAVTTS
uniref:Uncharacterized protein n=1 Tax=Felis catus TaxID=9685 RepID=A0ABI7WCX6_FELCA